MCESFENVLLRGHPRVVEHGLRAKLFSRAKPQCLLE